MRRLFKQLLFVVIIPGIIFSSAFVFFLLFRQFSPGLVTNPILFIDGQTLQNTVTDESNNEIQAAVFTEPEKSILLFRLSIPKIGVETAIESVGLTSQGAVDVPKDPANAAWFNLGPRPGEIGSAVITGHYGRWKNGEGSVFDDLNKLSQGDNIYIEDEKGETITFVVHESRKYDPATVAPEVFSSNDGKAHLNLITCEGVWNNEAQQYSERLVVFADKE